MEYYAENNKESILKKLNKYGVAVLPSLLNKNEIKKMNDGMWDFLEHITSDFKNTHGAINRNDKTTWKSFYDLFPMHSMLIQHWSIGHAQHVWDLRQNPKIVDVFAKIWDVNNEDLLTSFDASSFHFPPEETKRGFFKKYWFHADQSFTRNNFECVQSWVTGYDVNEDDATLVILEGSNNYHEAFKNHFNIEKKDDWYQLNDEELKFYLDNGCKITRIACPAGGMVFWDSRTIHCGTEPLKTREKENFRNVSYICMMPRKLATEANLEKKRKAFNNIRTTTHWAHRAKLFSKMPRTYGGPISNVKQINQPILTELGKKLAGF
jgi:ectoine hydroxylase-related dioxygenase (phytanoyl-CoA dioxygenase family)